jgi:Flp pilus assembly protein TadG
MTSPIDFAFLLLTFCLKRYSAMKAQRLQSKNQEGAGLVEFAIVAPLLVILLFGLLEFGLSLYAKEVLTNASREGARYGVVYCSPRRTSGQIVTQVQDYLTKSGFTDTPNISVTGAGGNTGGTLTVSVTYPYTFQVLPGIFASFFDSTMTGSVTLHANTAMVME